MEVSDILQSKLMAKVVIQSGRKIEIVAVFEQSTQRNCFFVFTASKPTAPQTDWTFKAAFASYTTRGTSLNLDEFVAEECKRSFPNSAKWITTTLMVPQDVFDLHMDKVANPMKYLQRQDVPAGATFDIVKRKNKGGRGFYASRRNRSATDWTAKPANEVWVYVDLCVDCGQKHAIAHFPAGNTKCMGFAELSKNPGLVYLRHVSQTQTFVFGYRVDLPRSI